MAPGHEVAGEVMASNSSAFQVGDKVGVGCMVESCRNCDLCADGLENYCPSMIQTYSATFPAGKDHEDCAGYHTNGGYSEEIVVHERFVFKLPDTMGLEYAGPLLCAGITTYSPLARLVKGKKDQKVGVVGFGGLGMMAAKQAKAMGATVTIFSRSLTKAADAEKIGCKLVSHQDEEALKAMARTLDTIIDTAPQSHPIAGLLSTLRVGGTFCFLGGVPKPYEISSFQLMFNRYNVCGSIIGGVPETKEMLEFCAHNQILPDIRIIKASEAADVYQAMDQGRADAVRHVIDMSTLAEMF